MTSNQKEEWMEEFEKHVTDLHEKAPGEHSYFGAVFSHVDAEDDNTYVSRVADWGHVKTFITNAVQEAKGSGRKEMLEEVLKEINDTIDAKEKCKVGMDEEDVQAYESQIQALEILSDHLSNQ